MKRDMGLIRQILLRIEADRDRPLDIPEVDRRIVEGHFELLVEAGLVNAKIAHTGAGSLAIMGTPRLSWDGHEFLDAARNDRIWEKAKKTVGDRLTSVSFSVLQTLLTKLVLSELNINGP
ncbi:MAG: DUF2513 domain-containing protein [bacterium]